MDMSDKQNTAQDFGEPWETNCQSVYDRNGPLYFSAPTPELASRIVQCVNACQGMPDPAAEIQAMREVIREAAHAMENLIIAKRGGMQPANALIDAMTYAKKALAKLKPFQK